MDCKITALTSFPNKSEPGVPLEVMRLVSGHGVEGDMHKGGERQVSLLSSEAQLWRETEPLDGLCFKRFKANILIDGMPDRLPGGTLLQIGDVVLRVAGQGKECFDECNLHAGGIPCRLSQNAAFAAVEQGGTVRVGDFVSVKVLE